MHTTMKEIKALMDEMRKIAAKGERVIDCAIVCKALIRIGDAHQHDIDRIFDTVLNAVRKDAGITDADFNNSFTLTA